MSEGRVQIEPNTVHALCFLPKEAQMRDIFTKSGKNWHNKKCRVKMLITGF